MSNFRDRRLATRVTGPRRLFKSGADKLSGRERQGLFLDFTTRSVKVADATTAANIRNPIQPSGLVQEDPITSLLTYTSPSPKMTMGPNGLLRYGAMNLCPYSETFTSWTNLNSTDAAFSSSDFPNAVTITSDATSGGHALYYAGVTGGRVDGIRMRIVAWIKEGNADYIYLSIRSVMNAAIMRYRWSTNTFDDDAQYIGSTYNGTHTVDPVPTTDGFYKFTLTYDSVNSTGDDFSLGVADASGNLSHAVAGRTVILGRVQSGFYPSDDTYLRTEAATRVALPFSWDANGNCEGILVEEARTNLCLYSNDLTNAAWTKTNCTAAKTATGPDGVANSASTLTATAGNATCLQAITSSSAARITSCYIKRRTGTGDIEMTQDNGSTWAAVTVTADWTRVNIAAATLADPTVGLRIVTSGDEVDVALFQHEVGSFITSPIETFAASVTRAADNIALGASAHPTAFPASAYVEFSIDHSARNLNGSAYETTLSIGQSTAHNVHIGYLDGATSMALARVLASGGVVARIASSGFPTPGVVERVAARLQQDNINATRGGVLGTVDTSASLASADTTVNIGQYVSSVGGQLNGTIKKILLVPRAMSDAELQTLAN